MSGWRVNWRVKATLPVASVLLAGIAAFLWVTLSFEPPERQVVILLASAGAVVIAAVMLVVLAVLVQRPLVELQDKIARLCAGDSDAKVSFADRNDEIGDLGRNFNQMVRQLHESREEIQRLHRTQMTRAEHLATLGELAAGLAHEIRNPLAGIAGVMEMIERDLPPASPSREIIHEVQRETRHIQRILSDLLDYARPKPPQMRPADLNDTAEHAVALGRQQVASRPIHIRLKKAAEMSVVEHDPAGIEQVLLNLLLNALQAIPQDGIVTVEVGVNQDSAFVAVTDTGRGIAPQHLPNIFRPFYTTKGQGTGLGLSLARRIVEAHNGRIEVSSQPGQGSRFTVWLPLAKSAPGKSPS